MNMHVHGTRLVRPVDSEEIDLRARQMLAEAREDFYCYRQFMDDDLLLGWFQRDVAAALMQFYTEMKMGLSPVLVLEAPPQHGKSRQLTEFISWVVGHDPDLPVIYASFSEDLGLKANHSLQRIMDGWKYQALFKETRISATSVHSQVGRAQRNNYLLEFVDRKGSFRNTTVLGAINGMGLGLGIVDDPMKGRAEAQSKTIRDKTWAWLTDDFFSRFTKDAGMIIIMTRWHIDDPVGRWIEAFPTARVLKYPAIAQKDGKFRKKGEPLFPDHKPLKFLMQRKAVMTQAGWESVYQQNPIVVGGGIFPIDKFEIIQEQPAPRTVRKGIRYWDKAGTKDGGAFTAGVLMLELLDGSFVVSDVRRGQWSALERERRIKQVAEFDKQYLQHRVHTWIEQEPGSGGLESAESTIRNLKGHAVFKDPVKGDKETRAEPYAAQVQAGNVVLVSGDWNSDFVDEHETFPNGKFKDQCDAAAGAFAKVAARAGGSYDTSLSWVRRS